MVSENFLSFVYIINAIAALFGIVIDGDEDNISFQLVCEKISRLRGIALENVNLPNQDLSGLRTDAITLTRLGNASLQ
jgi:hypothetical protein